MDHLPTFRYMTEPYPRVPLISDQPYDGQQFDKYFARQGFTIDRLYERDFTQHPPEKTASFLQTWLFFGHLQEVLYFGQPYDQGRFVELDDYGFRLCTRGLEKLITDWAAKVEEMAKQDAVICRAYLTRVGVAQNTLNKIYTSLLLVSDPPLSPEAILCLGVMGCTFDHALQTIFSLGRGRVWGLDTLAATRMMAAGWCPRDIALARETFTEIPMFCASYLRRRIPDGDHWNCKADTCLLNNIDEKTYVTQHRRPGCRCSHFLPDQREIQRILEQGKIPVISMTSPGKDASGGTILDIKVKTGDAVIHYFTAISHVWSDGLGNPVSNSLPLCQFQFLYDRLVDVSWDETIHVLNNTPVDVEYDSLSSKKAVEAVRKVFKILAPGVQRIGDPIRKYRHKPLSIWMDTLCIPLDPRYRKMAISRMKDVYASASMTMVMDSEIMAIENGACSDAELAVRLGLSGWMRRAWTFQEGFLAGEWLRFLLRDGVTPLPLWREEKKENIQSRDLAFPWLMAAGDKLDQAVVAFSVKTGGAPFTEQNIPQSRLEEMALAARTFSVEASVVEESKAFFRGMRELWERATERSRPEFLARRIVAVWNTMQARETSRESDKFLCFAMASSLGGAQTQMVEKMLEASVDDRMKAWVQWQTIVPSELLFLHGENVERYSEAGYRWLPKQVYRVPMEDEGFGEQDKSTGALVFKKPGFVFLDNPSYCYQSSRFVISDAETQLRYLVELLGPCRAAEKQEAGTMAIVLRNYVGREHPEQGHVKMRGALLGSVFENDRKVWGEHVALVEVGLYIEEDEHPPVLARLSDGYLSWMVS